MSDASEAPGPFGGDLQRRLTALVVDHDAEGAEWVAQVLTSSGFEVRTAGSAAEALRLAEADAFDLVVIEAALDPGGDGVEVARRLRARSSTFIVLHAERNDEIDIVRGLNAGADAYLVRPLSGRELKVRIAAMMRRPPVPRREPVAVEALAPAADVEPDPPGGPVGSGADDGWVVRGRLRVHPDDALAEVDGRPLVLNPRAFDLLEVLLYAEGAPRTLADLAIAVHDDAAAGLDLERVMLLLEALQQALLAAAPDGAWIVQDGGGVRLA